MNYKRNLTILCHLVVWIKYYIRTNVREFLNPLAAGYLVCTHLLLFPGPLLKLKTVFEMVKSLMISSSMIELQKLLDKYPTSDFTFQTIADLDLFENS